MELSLPVLTTLVCRCWDSNTQSSALINRMFGSATGESVGVEKWIVEIFFFSLAHSIFSISRKMQKNGYI